MSDWRDFPTDDEVRQADKASSFRFRAVWWLSAPYRRWSLGRLRRATPAVSDLRQARWDEPERFSLLVKINGHYHKVDAVSERDKLHLHIEPEQTTGFDAPNGSERPVYVQIERGRLSEYFIEDVIHWLHWHDYIDGASAARDKLEVVAERWAEIRQERAEQHQGEQA